MFLYLCLKQYETTTNFRDIVELAVAKVNDTHLIDFMPSKSQSKTNFIVRDHQLVVDWFREFRKRDCFHNPAIMLKNKKSQLPPLLEAYPGVVKDMLMFCRTNIAELNVDAVHEFLLKDALPKLVKKIQLEQNCPTYSLQLLLKDYKLSTLCVKTVYNWMIKLGFKYEVRKKSYYVDSHESQENVSYRSDYINRYFEYELLSHRWYSITEKKRREMIDNGEINDDSGYKYETNNGEVLYEYYVDDHLTFQDACKNLPFGGHLSVRKPLDKKQIMMIGQDEAIMRKNLLTLCAWSMPDGARPLVPKDEGYGLMLSAMTCRESGFAFTVPADVLEKVNKSRENKKYSDEDAAKEILGSPFKKKLETSPFIRELEYGKNKHGYWSYDHRVLQLEDCVDVLKFMYPDFDFVFFFDHSNGHDRMRPNGLNLNKVNVKHGGGQPIMRNSEPLENKHFGPYHTSNYKLQPGSIQSMQFEQGDEGPCYMDDSERLLRMYDIDTGKTSERELTKSDLIISLQNAGIKDPCGSKEKLQELAVTHKLPIKFTKKIIKEGWMLKQKGALQILFERGWVDPSNIHWYTAKGREGPEGVEYSINWLMEKQDDFLTETTLLQYHANRLGVTLERSPKCHPEIAGEGIEYGWALSKGHYRRSPIVEKKTKDKFVALVRRSTDNGTVLNVERMRACSRRARQYMLVYKAVESINLNGTSGIDDDVVMNKHSILESSIKLYRKIQKSRRCHRSVLDNHLSDVRTVERECPLDDKTESKENIIRDVVSKMITL